MISHGKQFLYMRKFVLRKDQLNKKLMKLFKLAVVIILTSLISLFCVGYIVLLDKLLFTLGILTILLAFIFFTQLFIFIKDITESN